MKRIVSVVVALSLVASMSAVAGKKDGNAVPKEPKDAPPLLDLTLTGKITKTQQQTKDGKTVDHYVLTTAAGQVIELPIPRAPKAKKGEVAAPAINLDNYVEKMVIVTVKGNDVERKGVRTTKIKEIVSIVAETPPVEASPAAQ